MSDLNHSFARKFRKPELYYDIVYKLKNIFGTNNFQRIIFHYKKIVYNINVLQQTAFLVVNPVTVGNFAFCL